MTHQSKWKRETQFKPKGQPPMNTQVAPQTTATTRNTDPAHTAAESKVKHRIIPNLKGHFAKVTGVLTLLALFAGLNVTQARSGAEADVVTAIFNLENDAVKADLAGDPAFYQKGLAEDWTRGDSDGTYYTKADLLGLMADTKNIKVDSEKLSELRVRVYGNTAVATYKDAYDLRIMGEHRAHTIIATDTFVKVGSEWKQVASHGSEAK
jgi:hypothetical protein